MLLFELSVSVPYKFRYDTTNNTASFTMSVYDDVANCSQTNLAWLLTATSTTAQLSCTQGTFTYVPNGTVSTLWYTIGRGGGSGGGSTGSANGAEPAVSQNTMYVLIGVAVVVAIALVGGLSYWCYKRSQTARSGLDSGEAGQYSTLA